MNTRKCSNCKVEKPLCDFPKHKNSPLGHGYGCKECRKIYDKQDYIKCRRRILASKSRYARTPEAKRLSRANYIKNKYSVTLDRIEEIEKAQDGKCGICGRKPNGTNRANKLVIDHCHKTKRFRGLICGLCNLGLGYFTDNPTSLREAAIYLECHKLPDVTS